MANEFDAGAYTIAIRKTVEDGEMLFEARVAELPDLLVYAETAADAHQEMIDVITVAHDASLMEGRAFPVPVNPAAAEFSGRVTVRFARSEHARLARCAEQEGVSLNSLITTAVARMLGEHDGQMRAVLEAESKVLSAIALPQTTNTLPGGPVQVLKGLTLPAGTRTLQ